MGCLCTVEQWSASRKEESQLTTWWMSMADIVLRDISQAQSLAH